MRKAAWLVVCLGVLTGALGDDFVRVRHDAGSPVRPGSVIVVRATGPAGLKLSYSFGNVVVDLPMLEIAAGTYVGEYRVQRDESLNGLPVTVQGVDKGGQRIAVRAANSVGETVHREPMARPQISTTSVRPNAWLTAGSVADFVVTGTPGCTARVTVAGAVADYLLNEVADGRYERSWKVPPQLKLDSARCVVIVKLSRGEHEVISLAADSLAIDNVRPVVLTVAPQPDSPALPSGLVAAVVSDGDGVGLDPGSVRLSVDGQTVVTATAAGYASLVSWHPTRPLTAGPHEAQLDAADKLGNALHHTWRFTTGQAQAPLPVGPERRLTPPAVLSPADGAQVAEHCVFSGTGRPGTRVRLSISAKSDVAFLDLNRQLPDVLVDVDVTGRWASPPIAMRKPSELFEALFTVSALAVEGERTAGPTVIRVKRP